MTTRRNFIKAGALATGTSILGSRTAAAQGDFAGTVQSTSGEKSYAATGTVRPWTKAQRSRTPVAIDIHTHWAPGAYLKAREDLGQPDTAVPANYDMARRKRLMEELGIQTSLLTLGGFRPWGWATAEQGALMARVTNDAAVEAHSAFPQSFVAAIELNCSDAAGSLAELNRMAGKPGMVAVHLPTSLASREFLFEPAFAPVLARAEQLGLPIVLHPLDGQPNWFAGHRLADEYSGLDSAARPGAPPSRFPGLTNSLGNSLEIAVTVCKLINSGTLDKYPNLTFIATQGGGAIPYVMGRLENRSGDNHLKYPLHTYLRRFYYDSLTYWSPSLRFLAEMVGTDRIVLGTDNMYGAGENGPANQPLSIIDQANFPEQERDLVLRGNLKRLFRI